MEFDSQEELVAKFGRDIVESALAALSRSHPRYRTSDGLRRRCEWHQHEVEYRHAETRALLETRPRADHFRTVLKKLVSEGWSPISGVRAQDITEREVEEAVLVLVDLEREVEQYLDWQDAYRQTALVCGQRMHEAHHRQVEEAGIEKCPTFTSGGFRGSSRADYVAIAMGHRPLSLSPWATQTTSSCSAEGSTNRK